MSQASLITDYLSVLAAAAFGRRYPLIWPVILAAGASAARLTFSARALHVVLAH